MRWHTVIARDRMLGLLRDGARPHGWRCLETAKVRHVWYADGDGFRRLCDGRWTAPCRMGATDDALPRCTVCLLRAARLGVVLDEGEGAGG